MHINGKTIFITGTNRGIGAAFLDALLELGAHKIYASARNSNEIRHTHPRIEKLSLDITDPKEIEQAARLELRPHGISVHSVNPGPIDTDMAAGAKALSMELEVTSAPQAAMTILKQVEENIPDIFPDPQGQALFEIWKDDYRKLEANVAEMI